MHAEVSISILIGPLSAVGNLNSTEVDDCTLHVNWTAPYTLQGVPINYYIINITRYSDGEVLMSEKANTTSYVHNVIILGETLDILVAALNGAGTGNFSTVTIETPTSSEPGAHNERATSDIAHVYEYLHEKISKNTYTIVPSVEDIKIIHVLNI